MNLPILVLVVSFVVLLLLNVPVAELDGLASRHTSLYPMASRCGVFAKTDLQNLLSRQVPKEDVAASVFHAVVLQSLATLARGREVRPALLFSGGPLTFMPALRQAFLKVLELTDDQVLAVVKITRRGDYRFKMWRLGTGGERELVKEARQISQVAVTPKG